MLQTSLTNAPRKREYSYLRLNCQWSLAHGQTRQRYTAFADKQLSGFTQITYNSRQSDRTTIRLRVTGSFWILGNILPQHQFLCLLLDNNKILDINNSDSQRIT